MKWILPVVLLVAACGGKTVTTQVTTTSASPAASGVASNQGAGQAVGASAPGAGMPTVSASAKVPGADDGLVFGATAVAGAAAAFACLSDKQRNLVGKPLADSMQILPPDVRVITPGAVVTQEFLPYRMNADVDSNSVITRVWCG